jgi:S-DNA-T family DNA segregation ATPase FtsK/SpoIIIE
MKTPERGAAAVAGKTLGTLEIVNEGVHKGQKFEIRSPLTHIGRGAHNDIVLDDESVSDSHAKLQKREGGWYVADVGSTNGTYVAGKRVLGDQALTGSPDVRFGGVKMIFRPVSDVAEAEGKGTKMIAGITTKQAQAMRAAASEPVGTAPEPVPVPAKGGIPAWVWIVAAVVVLAALFFILKGQ